MIDLLAVDFKLPGLLELHRYPDALKEMWQTRAAEKMLLLFKHYNRSPSKRRRVERGQGGTKRG
jgi:hypothetical protein